MARYKSSTVTAPLPQRTLDYLEHGAPEGRRNAELFDAACQLRDAGQSLDDAESRLLARAVTDGLGDAESLTTIRSAFNGAAREPMGPPSGDHASRPQPRRVTGPPEPIEGGFPKLLAACFRPDEHVAIADTAADVNGEIAPRKGVTLTTAEWLERVDRKGGIDRVFSTKLGLFFRINPMTKGGSKDADVTSFRHTLVEFDRDKDGNPIPQAEQYRRIVESGLPVAVIIDSGNKSLHAIVRLNAPDAKEYRRRVDVVWKLFEGMDLDKQNRNPSRLSRCPDGWRTVEGEVRRQSLLATNLGAASWDAWEAGQKEADAPSSDAIMPISLLATYDTSHDPNNILGKRWLCRGGSLVVVGQSGIGKSSLCMQLMILWALGLPAFNITPVRPLRSLLIQAENDVGDLAEMYQGVRRGMGITPEQEAILEENIIIYRDTTRTGSDFVHAASALVDRHKPDLAWADPLLNYIGDEISDQRVISEFCCKMLNAVSLSTGVVWCLLHHTGKPSRDPKASSHWTSSDLAYSGLGSSALTNWARETAVLVRLKTQEGEPPTFQFSMTKRRTRAGLRDTAGKTTDTIFLRHSTHGGICWEQCEPPPKIDKEAKTSNYKLGGRKSSFDTDAFMAAINAFGGTLNRANVKTVAAAINCSERTAWTWWKKLKTKDLEVLQQPSAASAEETQPAAAASAATIPPL
ncbi:MAG: AAA family ATPase [Verrucomicrobia bacterium]|nr:AAA family ATPase [Verrucomicrobiota bacterium]